MLLGRKTLHSKLLDEVYLIDLGRDDQVRSRREHPLLLPPEPLVHVPGFPALKANRTRGKLRPSLPLAKPAPHIERNALANRLISSLRTQRAG